MENVRRENLESITIKLYPFSFRFPIQVRRSVPVSTYLNGHLEMLADQDRTRESDGGIVILV